MGIKYTKIPFQGPAKFAQIGELIYENTPSGKPADGDFGVDDFRVTVSCFIQRNGVFIECGALDGETRCES
jgi:hypothetical protein